MDYETDQLLDELYDYVDENGPEDEPQDKHYYLGTIYKINSDTNYDLLLEFRISTDILFRFPYEIVHRYAYPFSHKMYYSNQLEIVQIRVVGNCYCVTVKTFWLREFQRRWRRVYNERKAYIEQIRRNPGKYMMKIQRNNYISKDIK